MEQTIAYIVTALASITAIGTVIAKAQVAQKYIALCAACVKFIDVLLKSLDDNKLTEDEIKTIAANSVEIKAAYLLIKKK